MAHFARLDETGTVLEVLVVANSDCAGGDLPDSEPAGQLFLESLGLEGTWRQTSYNATFRRRYAGIGYRYHSELDMFIEPQPFPSWSLDSNGDWQPPTPMPADGGPWLWNETMQSWETYE